MKEMAIAEIMNEKLLERPEYLDDLDEEIISMIDHEGRIMLQELKRRLPEHRYQKLWKRVRTLGDWGYIKIGMARNRVICLSVEA